MAESRRVIYIEYTHQWVKKNKITTMIIRDSGGNIIRKFEHDPTVKKIGDFENQKKANEKALLDYYVAQSKIEYKEGKKISVDEVSLINFYDKDKDKKKFEKIEYFKNKNRLLISNKKLKIKYSYVYIKVKVKIYLDGYVTHVYGYSNHYDTIKYPNGIPDGIRDYAIYKAIIRALRPFGSNVRFKPMEWYYVYKQDRVDHF